MSHANLFQSISSDKHRKTCRFNSGKFWNTYGVCTNSWQPLTCGSLQRPLPRPREAQGGPKMPRKGTSKRGGPWSILEPEGAHLLFSPFLSLPGFPWALEKGFRSSKKIDEKVVLCSESPKPIKKCHMLTCICEGLS